MLEEAGNTLCKVEFLDQGESLGYQKVCKDCVPSFARAVDNSSESDADSDSDSDSSS